MTVEYAALLGDLARSGLLLRQDTLPLLPDLASVEAPLAARQAPSSGAVTLRAGEVVPERLAALGRTAQGVRLPPAQLELLITYAQRNPGAATIDHIYAGLVQALAEILVKARRSLRLEDL
jgi:hypothetical protein